MPPKPRILCLFEIPVLGAAPQGSWRGTSRTRSWRSKSGALEFHEHEDLGLGFCLFSWLLGLETFWVPWGSVTLW